MIVFLDIDGVMVHAKSWSRPAILEDGFVDFNPKAVRALNRIISETSAKIILTTSHKHLYSISEWKSIFTKRNVSINEISSLPENKEHLNRKSELISWFNINKLDDEFVIIDDDRSLHELPEFLKSKWIQTSSSIGLTENLAEEALSKVKSSKINLA